LCGVFFIVCQASLSCALPVIQFIPILFINIPISYNSSSKIVFSTWRKSDFSLVEDHVPHMPSESLVNCVQQLCSTAHNVSGTLNQATRLLRPRKKKKKKNTIDLSF